jgi:hypothetical protein
MSFMPRSLPADYTHSADIPVVAILLPLLEKITVHTDDHGNRVSAAGRLDLYMHPD